MFTKFPKLFSPDDEGGGGGDGSLLGTETNDDSSLLGSKVIDAPEKKEVIDTGNKQVSSPENALEKEAEKESDKKEPEKKEEAKPKAPEKYGVFNIPKELKIDTSVIEKASIKFKELDLTQEQAQSIIDLQTESVQNQNKQYQEMFEQSKKDWKQQTIKNLGANYQQELSYGAKARDQFMSSETVAFLDETGLLSHPGFVEFMINVGKSTAEDKLGTEGKKGGEPSLGEIFYPNMTKK